MNKSPKQYAAFLGAMLILYLPGMLLPSLFPGSSICRRSVSWEPSC